MHALLFSADRQGASQGVARVQAWRSKGRLPLGVDITALLISTRLRDPAACTFVPAPTVHAHSLLESTLASEYALAIIRFVNGISDASQKGKTATSVSALATSAGLHPMLVEVRHEATHNQMPSLHLLRLATSQALSWLRDNYWCAQASHLEESRSMVAATVADLWQNQQARARIAKQQTSSPCSSADDSSQEGTAGGTPDTNSAAALKRRQRAVLGSLRNLVPESGASEVARVLVQSSARILWSGTADAALTGEQDSWKNVDDSTTAAHAAALLRLGKQYPRLAQHTLLAACEGLASVKGAIMLHLASAPEALPEQQAARCRALAWLCIIAHRAVQQDCCQDTGVATIEAAEARLVSLKAATSSLPSDEVVRALCCWHQADKGEDDRLQGCIKMVTAVEAALSIPNPVS